MSNVPLQLSKNGLSTRDGDLAGALLILGIGDLAVVEDHGPASIAVSHTSLPAMLLGEEGLCVAEEEL